MKDELGRRMDKLAIIEAQRIKDRYHLSKRLGFTNRESIQISHWKVSRIVALAQSRGYVIPPELLTEIAGKGDTNAL